MCDVPRAVQSASYAPGARARFVFGASEIAIEAAGAGNPAQLLAYRAAAGGKGEGIDAFVRARHPALWDCVSSPPPSSSSAEEERGPGGTSEVRGGAAPPSPGASQAAARTGQNHPRRDDDAGQEPETHENGSRALDAHDARVDLVDAPAAAPP